MPSTTQIIWIKTSKSKESASISAISVTGATSLPTTPPVTSFLPYIGESVAIDGESYTVKDITTSRDDTRPSAYNYEISLSNSTEFPSGGGGGNAKPWDQKPSLDVTSNGREVLLRKDKTGRPVLNSAGQAPITPIKGPSGDVTINIKRNRQLPANTAVSNSKTYNFKMNNASITIFGQTFPKHTLMCRYTATVAYDFNTPYLQETITLEENSETWVVPFLDEGLQMRGIDLGSGVVDRTKLYRLPARGGNATENPTNGEAETLFPDAWINTNSAASHAKGAGQRSVLIKGKRLIHRAEPFLLNGRGRPLTGMDIVTAAVPVNQPSQDEAYNSAAAENVPHVDTAKSDASAVYLKYQTLDEVSFTGLNIEAGF